MKRFLLATTALLYAHAAEATTYYVSPAGKDTNAGTSAAPWATGAHASQMSKPGDIVDFMTGTYQPFTIGKSGTATAYITYQAGVNQHPVILKTDTTWDGIAGEADYIVISGLTIHGNILNHTVDEARAAPIGGSVWNGACIGVAPPHHHWKIHGNLMEYCPGAGIFYLGDYGWIYNNTVAFNAYYSTQAESGIIIQGHGIDNHANPKIFVYQNFVHDNKCLVFNQETVGPGRQGAVTDGQGIIVDTNDASTGGSNYLGRTEIYDNVIWNNGGWGLVIHRSQHVDAYENTTWANGTETLTPAPYTSSGGELGFNSSTDVRIENNIFVGNVPSGIFWGQHNSSYVLDYNIFLNVNGPIYYYNGAYGFTPTGPHDMLQINPLVIGGYPPPQYFMLSAASPAIGTGDPALTTTTDFAGRPRIAGSVDRGAYRRP